MFATSRGRPIPFGASILNQGVNFALFSEHATAVTICLFSYEERTPLGEIHMPSQTGNVWHICLYELPECFCYAFRVDGAEDAQHVQRFDPSKLLLDPYAKHLSSPYQWGEKEGKDYAPLAAFSIDDPDTRFEWDNDQPLNLPMQDLLIYEMHVRGFTQDSSSGVMHPGTFNGIIEKIPYLKQLGVNALELLPLHEFNENEWRHLNPLTKEQLYNYWGYSTVHFFSPMNRYSSDTTFGGSVREFKRMVKELHKNGMEVILDVVFNHTAEGNEHGPTYAFRGLANSVYYMLEGKGQYANYSGCGNTLNCNQPVVVQLILDCLRYWVVEMHVDGFRFDLASIFTRNPRGIPVDPSIILEMISNDPVLRQTKLIAEAWDAAGLYQVGSFYAQKDRWSEWNGKYRDAVRKFIKGTQGLKGEFATRLSGSQDLYGNARSPRSSVNFVIAHDGFSLADLVAYNYKHNEANDENNRDGSDTNDSWNCGAEGDTNNGHIIALRHRQMRNLHVALMVSQGVPMIGMGDEYAHSKQGNNNTWCQDNALNWFLWDRIQKKNESNPGFFRFYQMLIKFRKQHPIFCRSSFLNAQDIEWHGVKLHMPEWHQNLNVLAFTLYDREKDEAIYVAFNAQDTPISFALPPCPPGKIWQWIVNTYNASPFDFYDESVPCFLSHAKYRMASFSAIILKQVNR